MSRIMIIVILSAFSAIMLYSHTPSINPAPFAHRNEPDYMEYVQIRNMDLDLEYGIKEQDIMRFMKWFLPDSTLTEEKVRKEKEDMLNAMSHLFPAFNARRVPSCLAGKRNTWDFCAVEKNITFSADRQEAWLELEVGFTDLPGDPAVLDALPAEQVSVMNDLDKEMKKKFRPVRLHLKKIGGVWKISSFGGFAQALNTTVEFYRNEAAGSITPVKRK